MGDIMWTTKDGREISIKDMEDSHLHNTILFLDRHMYEGANFIGVNTDLAETLIKMEEERINRGMPLPIIPFKSLAYIKGEIQ